MDMERSDEANRNNLGDVRDDAVTLAVTLLLRRARGLWGTPLCLPETGVRYRQLQPGNH